MIKQSMKHSLLILSLLLTPLTSFAKSADTYSDYRNVPAWAQHAFEGLLQADIIHGTGENHTSTRSNY